MSAGKSDGKGPSLLAEEEQASADTWIWNQYWHFDRIASCLDEQGAENYDESVSAGWRAFFEGLPDAARILDLCTGNGAVALIAAEVGRNRQEGFEITAVDKAEIDPVSYVSRHREALAGIAFRPGTEIEALPFADGGFDAAVSQYGIEYSDLGRSVGELVRMIAPGGRARLVLHAAEGAIGAKSKRVIEDADFLLETIDLPGTAARCFVAVTAAERDPGAGEEAHREARERVKAFEAALMEMSRRIPAAVDKAMLRNCGAVLLDTFKRHGKFDVDQLVAKADQVRTHIRAHRGRLQALVEAAVTRDEVATIADRLRDAGAARVDQTELRSGSELIGHVLEAQFPS